MTRSEDPLVTAIREGTLDSTQRAALAALVAVVAHEIAGDAIGTPGTLMDHTIIESGRWNSVRQAWARTRRHLYPKPEVRT